MTTQIDSIPVPLTHIYPVCSCGPRSEIRSNLCLLGVYITSRLCKQNWVFSFQSSVFSTLGESRKTFHPSLDWWVSIGWDLTSSSWVLSCLFRQNSDSLVKWVGAGVYRVEFEGSVSFPVLMTHQHGSVLSRCQCLVDVLWDGRICQIEWCEVNQDCKKTKPELLVLV